MGATAPGMGIVVEMILALIAADPGDNDFQIAVDRQPERDRVTITVYPDPNDRPDARRVAIVTTREHKIARRTNPNAAYVRSSRMDDIAENGHVWRHGDKGNRMR